MKYFGIMNLFVYVWSHDFFIFSSNYNTHNTTNKSIECKQAYRLGSQDDIFEYSEYAEHEIYSFRRVHSLPIR